jgi:hypothetical protein
VSLMASLGTLGLVVDVGYATYRRHVAQAAAEAAVVGGVGAAVISSGCNITCGSKGVVCYSTPVQCSSPLPKTPVTNADNACMYASTNGFRVTTGGNQNVTVASGTGAPPTTSGLVSANVPYWMTVRINEQIPQTFSAVLGNRWANVSARATAVAQASGGPTGCVYVLNKSANALTFSGSPTVTSGCGIYVESTSTQAILSSGTPTIDTTNGAKTWVWGGVLASGTLTISPSAEIPSGYTCSSPAVHSCTVGGNNQTSPGDPYANWFSQQTTPSTSPCSGPTVNLSGSSTMALRPGCYSSAWTLSGNSYVTLSSGVYVLKGGITISGSGAASGTKNSSGTNIGGVSVDGSGGVMIYMPSGGITMSGSGLVWLSPQNSGTFKGITLWQPSSNSSADALSGTTSQYTTGLLYAPASTLTYSGGSGTSQATLVVKDVVFSGTTYINNPSNTSGGGGCTNLSLVE